MLTGFVTTEVQLQLSCVQAGVELAGCLHPEVEQCLGRRRLLKMQPGKERRDCAVRHEQSVLRQMRQPNRNCFFDASRVVADPLVAELGLGDGHAGLTLCVLTAPTAAAAGE